MTTPTPQTFGEFRDELHSGNPGPTINEMYFAKLAWTASAQSSAARVRELEGELTKKALDSVHEYPANQFCAEHLEDESWSQHGCPVCQAGKSDSSLVNSMNQNIGLQKQNSVLRECLMSAPVERSWEGLNSFAGDYQDWWKKREKALEAAAPSEKGGEV